MEASNDPLYALRHSLAHVMAQAVLEIRPNAKLAFGPPIDNGCYYDFDFDTPLTPEDFKAIEKGMRKIIGQRQPFVASKRSAAEAVEHLKGRAEHYKVEYCLELAQRGETEIGFYTNGPFEDMCAGPHLEHTGQIPPDCFAVDSLAGAYWRGDEKNKQLTRVYCLAFKNKDELKSYIEKRELAREREHRKLGKELDLFSIDHEGVGSGLILWHPKGGIIRHLIESHCRAMHIEGGYEFVYSPHIGRSTLWETSGHLSFYKDGMFAPIEVEGQEYYLKPMNCPFHCKIYDAVPKSYRDLPKRFAEWGTVYRFERSGTLSGLTRVRGFTQDDAHLFCREDQMPSEIDKVLSFSVGLLRDFGLKDFHLYLSTRPAERVGAEENWDAAENALTQALERSGLPYSRKEGDGAFYGPKIDICVKDMLDRQWQLSTIQFDFNLPERFDLGYTDADGGKKRPYMIHRALCGSMERFFAILIEHFGGAFPTWLAPVQAMFIPVNETCYDYVNSLKAELDQKRIRSEIDLSADSFNKKIRNAVTQKIPNIVIVGNNEVAQETITLRRYCVKEQLTIPKDAFVARLERLTRERLMDNFPDVEIA
jgi:threonyl-tRNA synthetase